MDLENRVMFFAYFFLEYPMKNALAETRQCILPQCICQRVQIDRISVEQEVMPIRHNIRKRYDQTVLKRLDNTYRVHSIMSVDSHYGEV